MGNLPLRTAVASNTNSHSAVGCGVDMSLGSSASQLPVGGRPNCCVTAPGIGEEEDPDDVEEPPPPPAVNVTIQNVFVPNPRRNKLLFTAPRFEPSVIWISVNAPVIWSPYLHVAGVPRVVGPDDVPEWITLIATVMGAPGPVVAQSASVTVMVAACAGGLTATLPRAAMGMTLQTSTNLMQFTSILPNAARGGGTARVRRMLVDGAGGSRVSAFVAIRRTTNPSMGVARGLVGMRGAGLAPPPHTRKDNVRASRVDVAASARMPVGAHP